MSCDRPEICGTRCSHKRFLAHSYPPSSRQRRNGIVRGPQAGTARVMLRSMRWMLLSEDVDCTRWPAPIRHVTRASADTPGFAVRRIQGIAPYLRLVWRCGPVLLLPVRRRRHAGARAVRAQENTSELSYLYQKEHYITRKNSLLDHPEGAMIKSCLPGHHPWLCCATR